ncbi:hypothetical protein [Bauldia sp.]|uniref:hypothetical protein n=1 Tax=Bauldia sp. TaxID=2575872 RepID=UPI003BAA6E20
MPVFRHGRGLTEAERDELIETKAVLTDWLAPAGPATIGALVLPVLVAFKVRDTGEAASARAQAYAIGLSRVPLNALEETCRAILAGETDLDRRFAPTPAEIAAVARAYAAPVKVDLMRIDALLAAGEESARPDQATRDKAVGELAGFVNRGRAAQAAVDQAVAAATGHQEARRAEGPTGTREEARRAEGPTGTKKLVRSAEERRAARGAEATARDERIAEELAGMDLPAVPSAKQGDQR